MTTKKPKLAIVIILGLMVATFIAVSCNNSDKKETTPENKTDTTKMDTASTRPVKGGD